MSLPATDRFGLVPQADKENLASFRLRPCKGCKGVRNGSNSRL